MRALHLIGTAALVLGAAVVLWPSVRLQSAGGGAAPTPGASEAAGVPTEVPSTQQPDAAPPNNVRCSGNPLGRARACGVRISEPFEGDTLPNPSRVSFDREALGEGCSLAEAIACVAAIDSLTTVSASLDTPSEDDLRVLSLFGARLAELQVDRYPGRDLRAVGELRDLRALWLHGAYDVKTLDGLGDKPRLDQLWVMAPFLENIDAIRGAPAVRTLDLTDVDPTVGTPALERIDALQALTQLERLWVPCSRLGTLTPLARLPLVELTLEDCRGLDLAPLGSIQTLRALSLTELARCDPSALAKLTKLEKLTLDHGDLTDLTALTGLTGLRELSLDGTQVTDLRPLAKLSELTRISVRETDVRDLRPLIGLPHLEYVHVSLSEEDCKDLSHTKFLGLRALPVSVWDCNL